MAIKCRGELLDRLYTWINTKDIVMASKMVEDYSGMHLQPHKAIVGANAFAHQCGIHQDGVLKNKSTYEIISPEDIGLHRTKESGLTLGKLHPTDLRKWVFQLQWLHISIHLSFNQAAYGKRRARSWKNCSVYQSKGWGTR